LTKIKKETIRYSQCWEDTNIVLSALDVNSEDVVLSIGSGGCNSFSIISKNPAKLFIVDSNNAQIELINLKFCAIKTLNYNNLLEFLGVTKSTERLYIYKNIENNLPESTILFWTKNQDIINKGVIHSGKFEKYLNFFRKFILPLIQPTKNLNFILNCEDKNQQLNFYNSKWNNLRWKIIFKLFFGKRIMKKRGRSEVMFDYEENTSSGEIFFRRFEKGLKSGNIFKNEYLEYILKGNYFRNLPFYLNEENLNIIKENITDKNIKIIENNLFGFLEKMPNNSISKFNLSDIFEALSVEFSEKLFSEILRVAKNNARIIFWNNLVYRDIPENIKTNFILNKTLINKMNEKDKIFFYEKFYIYEINK